MRELSEHLANLDWIDGEGPWIGVVLHSRATLLRNLPDVRFPAKSGEAERQNVISRLSQALEPTQPLKGATALTSGMLGTHQRLMLVETGLAGSLETDAPLILAQDGRTLARLHAQDHLELVVLTRGFDPLAAMREVLALERDLDGRLEFAFDDQFGYLTSDASNCGPGLILEALVHLPGLLEVSRLPAIIDDLSRQGLSVTSFPGLNERVTGGLLRLRTTASLGRSEKEIGRDFVAVVANLVKAEIDQRHSWLKHNRLALADRVHRALGVMREARLLSQDEALLHLSYLRLGRHSGLLADELPVGLDPMLYRILPGHLASWAEMNHEDGHPDALRARYIRRFFA